MSKNINDTLDGFQKKVIYTKLKEHNVMSILYDDSDYRTGRYCVIYDYEDQIFCSLVDYFDSYNTNNPIPSIETFVKTIDKTIESDKISIDKALYVNTVFDSFNMNGHADSVTDVMQEQLENLFNTGAFDRSRDKYEGAFYRLDQEVKKLVARNMSRPNIYKSIMQDLFMSKEQINEALENYEEAFKTKVI